MIVWRIDPDMRRVRKGSTKANVRRYVNAKLQMVGAMYSEAMRLEAPRSPTNAAHGADKITFRVGDGVIDFPMPDYFEYVVRGTRAHDIVAHGRTLAFEWDGRTVFFRSVRHPGTKPNDFIKRAWKAVRGRALALLGSAPREWWAGR